MFFYRYETQADVKIDVHKLIIKFEIFQENSWNFNKYGCQFILSRASLGHRNLTSLVVSFCRQED